MAQSTTNRDQVESESERAKEPSSELIARVAHDSPPPPDSPPDWLSLDEHEEFLWEDSPSSKTFLPDLGLSIVIVGIGVILASIVALQLLGDLPSNVQLVAVAMGGIMMVAGIGFLIVNYRSYRWRHYVLTTEAIYRRWNGSATRIKMMDICEVSCEQSWLDRQFSCGDLQIQWWKNGTKKTIYPAVPHSNQLRERLSEVALERRRKTKLQE